MAFIIAIDPRVSLDTPQIGVISKVLKRSVKPVRLTSPQRFPPRPSRRAGFFLSPPCSSSVFGRKRKRLQQPMIAPLDGVTSRIILPVSFYLRPLAKTRISSLRPGRQISQRKSCWRFIARMTADPCPSDLHLRQARCTVRTCLNFSSPQTIWPANASNSLKTFLMLLDASPGYKRSAAQNPPCWH